MPPVKVNVKWGKEKFGDLECNTDEPPVLFKAQLFALCHVPVERQKLMVKGAVIGDDDWGKIRLKDGTTLLMMGTAEELPSEPKQKTVFVEDMTDEQLATAMEVPAGLTNLGNTCYMNATLQCLRAMPELKDALTSFKATGGFAAVPEQSVTAAIRDLYQSLERTAEPVPPLVMLNVLHMGFPQFAEKDEQGHLSQQDANECWNALVMCLQKQLPPLKATLTGQQQQIASQAQQARQLAQSLASSLHSTGSLQHHNQAPPVLGAAAAAATDKSFIDQYMAGRNEISLKCVEAENEPVTTSNEPFYQLSCFIEKDVKYLQSGLKNKLEEHITKNSPTLGRDAQYLKTSRISRLPAYLSIQMVRFFYKEKEKVNAKILKDIKFPLVLDVYELCAPELQQKLIPMRDKMKAEDEKNLESKKTKRLTPDGDNKADMKKIKLPFGFEDDPGSNNSGFYDLQAVLTHKGRSSTSGHYVAWVKRKGDEWLMFDDDRVAPVPSEDILRLSGGGDWHCAYVLLYGPKVLEVDEVGTTLTAMAEQSQSTTTSTPME